MSAYTTFRESCSVSQTVAWLRRQVNPSDEQIRALQEQVRQMATPLAVGTGQAVGGFLAKCRGRIWCDDPLALLLPGGRSVDDPRLMHLSPLDDRYEEELLNEFSTISRAVVLATLLSAFAQGLLASIGYFFAGFRKRLSADGRHDAAGHDSVCWRRGRVGSVQLWLLFYEQRTMPALALALYGALVVSMIDNLIKPMVLHGQSKLHPLLALLSILGGMKALGPIGIFVGPMGMAFLQALLHMLHTEIVALDDPAPGKTTKSSPPAR